MKWLIDLWRTFTRPAKYLSVGTIAVTSFALGIFFWGGLNATIEHTSSDEFCVSCHSMEENAKELQHTIHGMNRTGVTAQCADCHIPHELGPKLGRKFAALNDIWGEMTGVIDTDEKFEAKRLEMAQKEWKRFAADGSQSCKNCHAYDKMNWEQMSDLAQQRMIPAAAKDQSCMDCHKGIAHELPDMDNSNSPELISAVGSGESSLQKGQEYYSILSKPLYTAATGDTNAGKLNIATKVKVLEIEGDRVLVGIDGWRKRIGAGRVIYFDFGVNILSAQLTKEEALADGVIQTFDEKEDPLTGLTWQKVEAKVWTDNQYLTPSADGIWDYASGVYESSCSVCHAQPDVKHYDANTWPSIFQGMVSFTSMDKETQALIQKYLQEHSSTFGKHE
ncbi:NapC/NirT family cytochrome c [Vibrio sp. SS-MA-C1-2]|uniref:NapC/NirT family cytochrome c n=1 Tax=Vibrio sp. SS-MA-C1-2 TaxID=2908646 RepID=UPI001F402232|nr:NapC/NirT family cytochrome c [Vibrio sp. SS-MA-C1-2]UJF18167.1 NapC/NirT family cytochrome c [Vibrio sp. SS-MA-C1-2]